MVTPKRNTFETNQLSTLHHKPFNTRSVAKDLSTNCEATSNSKQPQISFDYFWVETLKYMVLAKGHLYHIYNQGNNKQKIFFERKNYLFFLEKVKKYILPFADILAWTLMPNHFHLMVLVNEEEIEISTTHGVTRSHPVSFKTRSINNSIAILLRSYTRAINKQNKTSGALFREGTKAECISCRKGITPSFFDTNRGTIINIHAPEKQYPQVCFDYIHQNPVKAGLVKTATDWEFSSAKDYAGLRNGKLINMEVAEKYVSF